MTKYLTISNVGHNHYRSLFVLLTTVLFTGFANADNIQKGQCDMPPGFVCVIGTNGAIFTEECSKLNLYMGIMIRVSTLELGTGKSTLLQESAMRTPVCRTWNYIVNDLYTSDEYAQAKRLAAQLKSDGVCKSVIDNIGNLPK